MTHGTRTGQDGPENGRKRLFLITCGLVLSLWTLLATGCASSSVSFKQKDKSILQDDSAPKVLAKAALRVSRDWDRLLSYQSHLPPQDLGISRIQKTGTMGRRFTLKYVGPVEPFLRHLGKTARWGLKVIGKRPASQPMIEIRSKKEPLYDILRDAGVQVSPAAWIVLRPDGREIDLIYPPPIPPKTSETKEGLADEK
ncbi:MAG: DotD/TraH family lipoprotein [Leptospirales bacterium]